MLLLTDLFFSRRHEIFTGDLAQQEEPTSKISAAFPFPLGVVSLSRKVRWGPVSGHGISAHPCVGTSAGQQVVFAFLFSFPLQLPLSSFWSTFRA